MTAVEPVLPEAGAGPWVMAVEGLPKPQARPRHRRGQRHHYSPKSGWFGGMVCHFQQVWAWAPLDGPLQLELAFFFPKPKSARKDAFWNDKRPDLDNLEKGATDALMDAGVLAEDARVVQVNQQKLYAQPGRKTGLLVRIRRLPMQGEPIFEAAETAEAFA